MIRTENYTRELLFIFFAQRKIIIIVTLLILALSIIIALFWPPTYASFGSILVRGTKLEKSPEAIEKDVIKSYPVAKEDLFSEVQILTSFDVIERTIKHLIGKNLYEIENNSKISFYDDIKRKINYFITKDKLRAKGNSKIYNEVYKIKSRIKTEVLPASNVIEVTFYHKNPKNAVTILDALMSQYIKYRMGVYTPSEAEEFFSQQAEKFKASLEKREEDLMDLVKETRMTDPVKEIANNISIKKDLEDQLNMLKNDYIEKIAYVEHLDNVINSQGIQYFSFIDNYSINKLSEKLQDLFVEKGRLLRRYNSLSDKAELMDRQINDTYSALKSEVIAYKNNINVQAQIIQNKIKSIEYRLGVINERNVKLQRQLVDSLRIAREADLLKFSYDNFAKRREEATVDNTVAATNLSSYIRILSKPFPSNGPVFPRPSVVIPLGLLIGFITGFSLGFVNEYFDHTFKKPSDVSNYADLPVIFSIPKLGNNIKELKTLHIGGLIAIILFLGTFVLWILLPGAVPFRWNNMDIKAAIKPAINKKDKMLSLSKGRKDSIIAKSSQSLKIKDAVLSKAKFSDDIENEVIATNEDSRTLINLSGTVHLKKALMTKNDMLIEQSYANPLINKSIIFYDKNQRAWFLQVHSFRKKELAIKEAEKLKNAGWQSFARSVHIKGYGLTHRVLVGPFSQKEEALKAKFKGQAASLHSNDQIINP